MAKFTICFKQVRIYYDYEVVETTSLEEAKQLAVALVDNGDFQLHIDDEAEYEDAEYYVNNERCAWETTDAVTLSKEDIDAYLNEEE